MRDPGRITAAIDVLAEIEDRRRPAKQALKDWGAAHRFAGAKDRAWISGLVLDTLRQRRSLAWRIGVNGPRARILAALRWSWGWDVEEIAQAAQDGPHATGPLYPDERDGLGAPRPLHEAPTPVRGDYPDWLEPAMTRAFGEERAQEGAALAERAPLDLRVNTLKTTPEKALRALASIDVQPPGLLQTALRTPPPPAQTRAGHVESIPAFSKGWVEVQDLGSQLAAAAAGDVAGAQVLDLCAGGGGKTLALSAMMGGTGQIYAYDADPRRLMPTIARARRAGVRNLQIRDPRADDPLADLVGRMDVVFVDAPCTGSGVWRRQPDAKWRLRAGQLARRTEEQDAVLGDALRYLAPGGRLVYATCSVFLEEGRERLAGLCAERPDLEMLDPLAELTASGLLAPEAEAALAPWCVDGVMRLTPRRAGVDGFTIGVLRRGAGKDKCPLCRNRRAPRVMGSRPDGPAHGRARCNTPF